MVLVFDTYVVGRNGCVEWGHVGEHTCFIKCKLPRHTHIIIPHGIPLDTWQKRCVPSLP